MSLEIEPRDREGITILELNGRITMGDEVTSFRQKIGDLAQTPDSKVILNMQHVDYIDSTGLGAIVMGSSAVRGAGGTIKLVNLNRRNVELLVATKLATIFEIFNDEQDAVNSFFPGREIKGFDILEFVKTQKQD
jgi:anti-sigma B factor antagonist